MESVEVKSVYHKEFTTPIIEGYNIHTVWSSVITSRSLSSENSTNSNSFNFTEWFSQGKKNFDELYNDTTYFANSNIKAAGDIDFKGVLASTLFNFVLFICLILGYEYLRRKLPNIFINKYQREEERQRQVQNETGATSYVPLSWLGPISGVSWSKILEDCGLDAYFYLRYIRMCLRVTSISAFWAMIILWPMYGTGGGEMTGFYFLSMANIKLDDDWRFWFSTAFMYIFTNFFFYVLNQELCHYISLRFDFLGKGLHGIHPQHHYSLLVEGIPKELRSDKALFQYFDRLFPGKVHSARVVVALPELDNLSKRKLKVTRKLEKSIATYQATGDRPIHNVGRKRCMFCNVEFFSFDLQCCYQKIVNLDDYDDDERIPKGTPVDSISYYTRELKRVNSEFFKMQKEKNLGAETGNVSILAENWFTYIAQATGNLDQYLNFSAINRSFYGSFDDDDESTLQYQFNIYDGNPSQDNQLKNIVEPGSYDKPLEERTFLNTLPLRLGFDFVASILRYGKRKIRYAATKQSVTSSMSSSGFVTFLDLTSVTSAANAPLTHKASILKTQVAPECRDVYWSNAHVSRKTQCRRENIANVCIALGAVLWSIPIAAIQAFASLDRIALIPGLEWLNNTFQTQDKVFVNAYLPVVALLGILMLLPIIFQKIAVDYERRKSLSDIQRSVVGRYFYYQLANVYIVVTAGSIWISIATILDHPRAIVEIFGHSLPFVVGYFVSVLITKTLAGLPMVILRTGSVFRFLFLRLMFRYENLTQRELDEVYRQERFYYSYEYPNQLFVIVICFTYVCIAPIILVVGAVYFWVALIVYKKQILFVCNPQYESGGSLFPIACKRTIIGLFLGQITFIGYLSVRKAFMQSLVSWPLLILTYLWMEKLQVNYIENSTALTLERAVDLDRASERPNLYDRTGTANIQEMFRDDHYRQPILTEKLNVPLPYRRGENDLLTEDAIRKLRATASSDLISHKSPDSSMYKNGTQTEQQPKGTFG